VVRWAHAAALAELYTHNCLRLARRHRLLDLWKFEKEGVIEEIKVSGSLSSASGDVLHEWALSGVGISLEALWDISDDLSTGCLVTILKEYNRPPLELFAVFAPGNPVPPRIRLFIDYIALALGRISRGEP
jgi:LysR family transcriptional regulator, transcriptional activator for dmlA